MLAVDRSLQSAASYGASNNKSRFSRKKPCGQFTGLQKVSSTQHLPAAAELSGVFQAKRRRALLFYTQSSSSRGCEACSMSPDWSYRLTLCATPFRELLPSGPRPQLPLDHRLSTRAGVRLISGSAGTAEIISEVPGEPATRSCFSGLESGHSQPLLCTQGARRMPEYLKCLLPL